jgi:transcription termination factor Rho
MNKAELESKPLSELHSLAAEAGVPKYRMLARGELVAKLSDGGGSAQKPSSGGGGGGSRQGSGQRERPPRRRSRSGGGGDPDRQRSGREPRRESKPQAESKPEPPAATPPAAAPESESSSRPRRRRRRFGRRSKEGITIQDLLLPPAAGRQAILAAETREGCTALLRGIASDLAADSKGPDPVVLLIDPSPEELADWKREAPRAEIVAAGQARHASDALAQAASRAGAGDDVILLVDSLTRLAAAYGDADSAKEFFDAGRVQGATGGGSLTVLAALERPASS